MIWTGAGEAVEPSEFVGDVGAAAFVTGVGANDICTGLAPVPCVDNAARRNTVGNVRNVSVRQHRGHRGAGTRGIHGQKLRLRALSWPPDRPFQRR